MVNRTGLGLIGEVTKRAQNEESLYYSALKKLTNASEREIGEYLKIRDSHSPESVLRPLDTGGSKIKIMALSGKKLFYQSEKLCYSRGTCGLKENGAATRETEVRIDVMFNIGTINQIFNSLPGVWSQKWFTQNQIVEIVNTLGAWFPSVGNNAYFLCKKDEFLPIDEENPSDNLIGLVLVPRKDGRIEVYRNPLGDNHSIEPKSETRILSPK